MMEKDWSYHQKVASIGFFGGLFWSCVSYALHYLNFTKYGPAMAMLPWALPEWKNTYLGHLAGIVFIALLSIAVAFLYRFLFQKFYSIWPGIGFGAGLWILVFYLLQPLFPGVGPVNSLDTNTVVTTLCLFVLYGVFIGYSIGYEHHRLGQESA
ncbi:YqhR family membrane protein [Alteribacillus persepolensis]|nr:YqhR family membrane protein [Alteribacillus persepolensis]